MTNRFRRIAPAPRDEATSWRLQMAPEEIGYVNAVLEAHEGLGYAHTLDRKAGLFEVLVMPGAEDDFEAILRGLEREADVRVLGRKRESPCKA